MQWCCLLYTSPQRQQLMQAIDHLKAEHEAGGTPCSIAAPDGRPVEYTFFVPQQYGEAYQAVSYTHLAQA